MHVLLEVSADCRDKIQGESLKLFAMTLSVLRNTSGLQNCEIEKRLEVWSLIYRHLISDVHYVINRIPPVSKRVSFLAIQPNLVTG